MATITALIITHNAERFMCGCLESVKGWVDEIIVIDMFSSDSTVKIASNYTDKIFQYNLDAVERREIGINKSTSDWILLQGATERIPESLKEEILCAIKNKEFVGYRIPRMNYIYGLFIEENPGPIYLFRKDSGRFPKGGGHRHISLEGRVGYLKNCKIHWASPTIETGVNKINSYTSSDAKKVFEGYHNAFFWKYPVKRANLFNMLYRPLVGFFVIYFVCKMYRHRMHGVIVAVMSSFNYFLEIAKLWELQYKQEHGIKDDFAQFNKGCNS